MFTDGFNFVLKAVPGVALDHSHTCLVTVWKDHGITCNTIQCKVWGRGRFKITHLTGRRFLSLELGFTLRRNLRNVCIKGLGPGWGVKKRSITDHAPKTNFLNIKCLCYNVSQSWMYDRGTDNIK